ncbi:hypothetical protein FOXYS1_11890, partial [Fusarium oxysporum]
MDFRVSDGLREDYGGVWGSARGAAKTGETRFSENWGPILVSLSPSLELSSVPTAIPSTVTRDHQNISNSPAPARSEANTQTLQHTRLRCKVLTPDKFKVKPIS